MQVVVADGANTGRCVGEAQGNGAPFEFDPARRVASIGGEPIGLEVLAAGFSKRSIV